MIVEKRCPRCGIRRTRWLGNWGWFCYNCRVHWHADAEQASTRPLPEAPAYHFRQVDLVRLQHYRAAIRWGLFTDWPDGSP
jgi:hypothetical protein